MASNTNNWSAGYPKIENSNPPVKVGGKIFGMSDYTIDAGWTPQAGTMIYQQIVNNQTVGPAVAIPIDLLGNKAGKLVNGIIQARDLDVAPGEYQVWISLLYKDPNNQNHLVNTLVTTVTVQ